MMDVVMLIENHQELGGRSSTQLMLWLTIQHQVHRLRPFTKWVSVGHNLSCLLVELHQVSVREAHLHYRLELYIKGLTIHFNSFFKPCVKSILLIDICF